MELPVIIIYISTFVWLFLLLKQFRGKLFYYFLLQAISDPVTFVLLKLNLHNLPFYLVKDLFIILLLWNLKDTIKKLPYLIALSVLIFYAADKIHYTIICSVVVAAHLFIMYLIFKLASADIVDMKKLKIFYVVILLYELTVIAKFIGIILSVHTGLIYHYITTSFEILLGIFFIIVGEDNTKFAVSMRKRNSFIFLNPNQH